MIQDDDDDIPAPEGIDAPGSEAREINELLTKLNTAADPASVPSDRATAPDLANLHVGANNDRDEQIRYITGSDRSGQFIEHGSERNVEAERSGSGSEVELRRADQDIQASSISPVASSAPNNRVPGNSELSVEFDDGTSSLSSDRDRALETSIGPNTDAQTVFDPSAPPPVSTISPLIEVQPDPKTKRQTLEARDDQGAVAENSVAVFDVLANDADAASSGNLHLPSAKVVSGQGAIRIIDDQLHYDPGTSYDHLGEGEQAQVTISYAIVNDAGDSDTATLDLTIIGGNDAPMVQQALAEQAALEDSVFSFTVPNDAFRDADESDALTYSATLEDGSDLPDWLHFDADTRTFSGTPKNDHVGDLQVSVIATDSHGIDVSDSFNLTVGNVNDAPDDLTLDGGSVIETAVAGTVVGTATARDSDVGDSLTYALVDDADGRFAIDSTTGQITVADLAGLDFETAASHDVSVRATDQAGASHDETFVIDVVDAVESLTGTNGNDTLTGGAGADSIAGGRGKDSLIGADGDDIIDGGSSNDTLYGNAGDDTLIGGSASGSGKNSEIGGNDTLYGGDGFDTLIGGDGADTLYGDAGDDVLDGGTGNDLLDGGAGNDQITYEHSTHAVHIDLGLGTGAGGDAEGDTIRNVENVVGSAQDDTLTGNTGVNTLSGGDGDDILDGGSNHDTLYGGAGDDTLIGGSASSGKNTMIGGDDTLDGGDGSDTLIGGDGADSLFGSAGDDVLDGGIGADVIDGGAGSDQVTYEHSDQAIDIDLSSGTGSGGDAEGDTIQNVENVIGSAYDDRLTGDNANNVLSGGAGDDVIIGGEGNDTLSGGVGNDILEGGGGDDHILLMMAQGNDVVSGGDGGWVDMIELQDSSGGSNIGEFGADWTVVIDSGAIENSGTSAGPNGESHGWLDLAEDTSGTIFMDDGTEIAFDGIEQISW